MVGEGRIPTPNRKFYRQPDETKLYTQRYLQEQKKESASTVEKFLKYAHRLVLKVQKDTMEKARVFLEVEQQKFMREFETESIVMIEQHQ